ncbi:hypothetical protein [Microbacterium aurum]
MNPCWAAARQIHSSWGGSISTAVPQLAVTQQIRIAEHVLAAGLVPILEPEVDIHAPAKADAEGLLGVELLSQLDGLAGPGRSPSMSLSPVSTASTPT